MTKYLEMKGEKDMSNLCQWSFEGYFANYIFHNEKTGEGIFKICTSHSFLMGDAVADRIVVKRDARTKKDITWRYIICDATKCPTPFFSKGTPLIIYGGFTREKERWIFKLNDVRMESHDEVTLSNYFNSGNFPELSYQQSMALITYLRDTKQLNIIQFAEQENAAAILKEVCGVNKETAKNIIAVIMKTKMEERMLVTVTLNLMHRLEDFQAFKEKENISGDYNAKILYIVRYFHVSDKTVENLLSGKYVSRANYLSIFPSFDSETSNEANTLLENLAEQITKEIEEGNEATIKEVDEILSNKLDKLDMRVLSRELFSESMEKSIQSSLNRLNKPSKGTQVSDYSWSVWNSFFYNYISERDDLYQIFSKFDTMSKSLDYLPLVEKIFETEDNLRVFGNVAERLDFFKMVDEYEDWDNLEQYIKSVQTRNGFDNYLE